MLFGQITLLREIIAIRDPPIHITWSFWKSNSRNRNRWINPMRNATRTNLWEDQAPVSGFHAHFSLTHNVIWIITAFFQNNGLRYETNSCIVLALCWEYLRCSPMRCHILSGIHLFSISVTRLCLWVIGSRLVTTLASLCSSFWMV